MIKLIILVSSAIYMSFMAYIFEVQGMRSFLMFKAVPFFLTIALMFLVGIESGILQMPE